MQKWVFVARSIGQCTIDNQETTWSSNAGSSLVDWNPDCLCRVVDKSIAILLTKDRVPSRSHQHLYIQTWTPHMLTMHATRPILRSLKSAMNPVDYKHVALTALWRELWEISRNEEMEFWMWVLKGVKTIIDTPKVFFLAQKQNQNYHRICIRNSQSWLFKLKM